MSNMNFVNLRYYKNETITKQPTTSKVQKSAYYYAFGTSTTLQDGTTIYPEEMRGEWQSPAGPEKHGNVVTWASGNALNHTYTYTMILSLRDGQMEPEDFIKAMESTAGEHFDDYRLIVHYDTNHDHAHVMAFRDTTLSKKEFNQFRLAMREQLQELESERIREREQEIDKGISIQDELDWEDDWGL